MSVSFAGGKKDAEYYRSQGYREDVSPLGLVFWPRRGVVVDGRIRVRYEEKPWLSAFEVDGIRPQKVSSRIKDRTREMQMVLQFARAFGRVTRANVMELCGFSPKQATVLLGKIERGGYIRKCGAGRGTYYVLTGKRG